MDQLITLLVYCIIFAVLAWVLYWICTKFFAEFPPARWICGAILLIVVLLMVAHSLGTGNGVPSLHFH